jgi:hypothetical protein
MRELEEDLGIPRTIFSRILTEDLGKKSVAAKFVPRLLSREQKEFRVAIAQDLFFGKTSHHPGLSAPLEPGFGFLRLLAFLKTENAIEREEILDRKRD